MENIELPLPTNATNQGPIIEARDFTLSLTYDNQSLSGVTNWAKITFREVLGYEVYQSVCSPAQSLVANNEVRVNRESQWLSEVLTRWSESVGWQEYQSRMGGPKRFIHYQVYFDDVCGVQVIAASCEIEPSISV